jgi:hypothetical protein
MVYIEQHKMPKKNLYNTRKKKKRKKRRLSPGSSSGDENSTRVAAKKLRMVGVLGKNVKIKREKH